jgi:hypothetical protein
MRRLALAPLLATLAATVHAHPGHAALSEWHWHASDTVGFVTVAALAAVAIWLSRGD